ncbi:2'-5' RNA ligase family protein [Yaniella halotolerans]|uniref:2'-5' RNA ligase family protein n=1 Tax=Yaniella halotolerans TaxID=225453 RepID=UPI0012EB5A75|nr:2'-5' RNA ligase family protein [Yaniella halotolerans]
MSRYFIGLMMPREIRQQLRPFIKMLHANTLTLENHKITWTAEADLHCTLLYIGEYGDRQDLLRQVERVARELPPITMSLGRPTRWLGINLVLPASGLDEAGTTFIAELGHLSSNQRAEDRPFYGHLTLGKVRPKPTGEADQLDGQATDELSWIAKRVQLVENPGRSSGARYRVVADVPLGRNG